MATASSSTRTADRRDGVAAALVGTRWPEQLGGWIGAAHLELSDELLLRSTQRSPRPAHARTRPPRGPGIMADVTTFPRRITARRAPHANGEADGSCAAHAGAQAAIDLLYREVSPDALQIPPLEVAITP